METNQNTIQCQLNKIPNTKHSRKKIAFLTFYETINIDLLKKKPFDVIEYNQFDFL
jgi:hypothetical protein